MAVLTEGPCPDSLPFAKVVIILSVSFNINGYTLG